MLFPAQGIQTMVGRDAVQPRAGLALAREALQRVSGLQENLLNEIFRLIVVLYISNAHPQHEIAIARVQLGDALSVSKGGVLSEDFGGVV